METSPKEQIQNFLEKSSMEKKVKFILKIMESNQTLICLIHKYIDLSSKILEREDVYDELKKWITNPDLKENELTKFGINIDFVKKNEHGEIYIPLNCVAE